MTMTTVYYVNNTEGWTSYVDTINHN